ncbi:hypothetical protein M2212_002914 [Bradyrhizobium elkanii]|jgi:hypothetical protein|nr:hypothetical protein [Bradyrhizobium elkanii]
MADSELYEFLRELNDDSNKLTEFENDPEAAMNAAGLTNESTVTKRAARRPPFLVCGDRTQVNLR